jgi:hypothetical protein
VTPSNRIIVDSELECGRSRPGIMYGTLPHLLEETEENQEKHPFFSGRSPDLYLNLQNT